MMTNYQFPTREELERLRQTNADFQRQVQELLDLVQKNMIGRGPINDRWGYLRFPPDTNKDVQEAVRDAINAVNNGHDWDASLATDEGAPALVVRIRQN